MKKEICKQLKNFKKVLNELKMVSSDFYVGGSLSLYVFHYITRTPKDLDIQSTDPVFLEMAKEMQELCPVPIDNRGGWVNTRQGQARLNADRFSPDLFTESTNRNDWEWLSKFQQRQRHASFMLNGTKIEVFNKRVEKGHVVHGYNFVDPNQVLFYKNQYLPLKRMKDIQDINESWRQLYPEKAEKYQNYGIGDVDSLFAWRFKMEKGNYAGNNLPTHIVELVVSEQLKPRSLTSHGKDSKRAREDRIEFLKLFNLPEKLTVEMPAFDRYLSTEPQRLSKNSFKLYGYPKIVPAVTLCSKTVLIVNDWGHKIRITREAFEALCKIPLGDVETVPELKRIGAGTWKLHGPNPKFPTVKFYPRVVVVKNQQGTSVKLEHKTFDMLQKINYGMVQQGV